MASTLVKMMLPLSTLTGWLIHLIEFTLQNGQHIDGCESGSDLFPGKLQYAADITVQLLSRAKVTAQLRMVLKIHSDTLNTLKMNTQRLLHKI